MEALIADATRGMDEKLILEANEVIKNLLHNGWDELPKRRHYARPQTTDSRPIEPWLVNVIEKCLNIKVVDQEIWWGADNQSLDVGVRIICFGDWIDVQFGDVIRSKCLLDRLKKKREACLQEVSKLDAQIEACLSKLIALSK